MKATFTTILTGVAGATGVEAVDHLPLESLPEVFDLVLKIVIGVATLWRLLRPKKVES